MSERVDMQPVDALDITVVVDNAIDILAPSTEIAQRPPMVWDWSEREQLRAEHGYAVAVTVSFNGRRETVLYDAGLGRDTAVHNLDVLGLRAADFRAIVLSHGHVDHHGGLQGLFRRLGRRRMPFLLHPDAWRDRRVVYRDGTETHLPPPSHNDLEREGWEVIEERGPSLLLDGALLVTGQVERTTEFEQGFPPQQAQIDGRWLPDPWIWDDQGLIVNVRGKGLVVVSSCSHAGVINILRNAQRLTGIEKIHAFAGGLHLSGGLFETIIPRTVAELAVIAPDVIVPGHCSGWTAQHRLAAALPDAYLPSNTGTSFHFSATAE